MNPNKTEFIYFGNKPQLKKCNVVSLKVSEDLIPRASSIRYLGVYMDEHLNYKQHVAKKCQAAMFNYFKIRSIRPLLDVPTTARLCLSLCILHLDYCNSVLYGLPRYHNQQIPENTEHVCSLNTKKGHQRKHHRVPEGITLAPNKTENTIQNTDTYP